jgi:hypothetical protein
MAVLQTWAEARKNATRSSPCPVTWAILSRASRGAYPLIGAF